MKICQSMNLPLINIVRKEEQVRILKDEYGAEHVLNLTDDDFDEKFKALAKELKATVAIDCIGGNFPAQLLEGMPPKSTVVFYGSLTLAPLGNIDPLMMIGRDSKIEGWVMGEFLKGMPA